MEGGGEFLRTRVSDKGWVSQTTKKLGLSSRAGVAACSAGPGMNLYLLVTCSWKGVGCSVRCRVVDEGLVMEQCMSPLLYSCLT